GATLELLRGRPEKACASLTEALGAAGDALARARLLPTATEAALAAGDTDTARHCADELARIADQFPTVTQHARAAQARGEVGFAAGELDLARDKLREAAECWQQVGARYDEARARVASALCFARRARS